MTEPPTHAIVMHPDDVTDEFRDRCERLNIVFKVDDVAPKGQVFVIDIGRLMAPYPYTWPPDHDPGDECGCEGCRAKGG